MNNSVKKIPLDGTGTEIPALNVTDSYEYYEFTGTVITTGNYAIVPTGTPQAGTTFEFDFNTTIDITTNGNTFQIFGVQLNQTQLLTKLTVICRYDGSAWKVRIFSSLDQIIIGSTNLASNSVTTAKINNEAVTNAKLAQMADQTVKANISGGSAVPQDVVISTLLGANTWTTVGNSGTVAGTNFIGTTDNTALVFKINNFESGRISNNLTSNTSFGYQSAIGNAGGSGNTSFGYNSLSSNTSGNQNTAIGSSCLLDLINGDNNIALGTSALENTTNGSSNIGIGVLAGDSITTGTENTIIGENADVSSATAINRIALGANALATTDNQFALPDSVTSVKWRGLTYTLPSVQAAGVLTNDGSGNLSWL